MGQAGGAQPYETYESAVSADGPVAQFRFGDAAGSTSISDYEGSYTATNSGIVLGGEGPFAGSGSGSFGGEAYATLPADPLAEAGEFTVEAWVDWAGGSTYRQPIFAFGSSSTNYMYLTPASESSKHPLTFEIHTSSGSVGQVTASKLTSKAWEYVAVTETNSGALTLYVNGEQVGEASVTVHPSSLGSVTADYLGRSISGEPDFKGSLSNVAFYTRALSAGRIAEHYNDAEYPVNASSPTISGTPRDGSTLTAHPGTWTGLAPIGFSYEWEVCGVSGECSALPGGTETKYKAVSSDVGSTLRVTVTGENSAGSTNAASAQTATIEALALSNKALPVISGEDEDGQLLSVSTGTWTGTEPITFTYQWQGCTSTGEDCRSIPEATAPTFRLSTLWVNQRLRAVVTAENVLGHKSATSETTAVVTPGPPVNTAVPSISGAAEEGQTLDAGAGSWAGTPPFTYGYQWQRCEGSGAGCTDIPGATGSSIVLGSEEVAHTVRVVVTASNAYGTASADSTVSAVITSPPANTVAPEISGTAEEGQPLSASAGTWRGYPSPTYTYQWLRCHGAETQCTYISGATGPEYTPVSADVGYTLQAVVTASNVSGSESAISEVSASVNPSPPSNVTAPSVSGAAVEGRPLTASKGAWRGGGPLTYDYQWESCNALGAVCMPIPGADASSYTVGALAVASTIRVRVTAVAFDYASASATSTATAEVAPGPHPVSEFGSDGSGAGQFDEPDDIAVDAAGDLLVLDSGNDRVEEFSASGAYLREFGSRGAGAGEFEHPRALAVAPDGDIWVLDDEDDRVEGFTEKGALLAEFSPGGEYLAGIAVDRSGDVWISNAGGGYLEIYSAEGTLLKTVGSHGDGAGDLDEPEGLAVSATGDVWVADSSNDRIVEFTEEGAYVREFGSTGAGEGELNGPNALAVDASGDVWVGEAMSDRVQEFTESGEYLADFGSLGSGEGEMYLSTPMGLASDDGDVWVTDLGNDRVDEWTAQPPAPTNTLTPSLGGEAVEGLEVVADPGEWTGSPSRYSYQWQRCSAEECVAIEGADGEAYTLGSADLGKTVRVVVEAVNAGGASAPVRSASTGTVVAATRPSNSAVPVISGVAQDGETLHVSTGVWTGTPGSFAYQWESCDPSGEDCAPVEGADAAQYTIGDGDVDSTLRALVSTVNAAGSAEAVSAVTGTVQAEPESELEAPSISGTPDEHQVLHADHGAWSGTARQFSYQWESCSEGGTECAPIEGATEPDYDLGEGDAGTSVRVRVGVASELDALTDVSAVTPVVGAAGAIASTSPPGVAGAAVLGDALTASTGGWAFATAPTYTYQWQSCSAVGLDCENVEGATASSYTPAAGDLGEALRVVVTASSGGHSASRPSAVTQQVAAGGAPEVEAAPAIAGTALAGRTLTASPGTWSNAPVSVAYQWERCDEAGACTPVGGATGSSYVLTEADVGARMRVQVSAAGEAGVSSAISNATAPIETQALRKFAVPYLAGVVEAGNELSATPGVWSGAGPVSYAYQWERCGSGGGGCVAIEGATEPRYLLETADRDAELRVSVTASNALGDETARSGLAVATPGGEVSTEQAEEIAQRTDPALFAQSSGVTIDGEEVKPSWKDEEALDAERTLTTSAVSKENPGEFGVNTPDGELTLKPVETLPGASSVPTLVNGTAALVANTFPATDTIVRPDALGATSILQMRSPEAPRTVSWELGLGAEQQLLQLPNGDVAVVESPRTSWAPSDVGERESRPKLEEPAESEAEKVQREAEEAEPESEAELEPLPSAPTSATAGGEAPAGLLEPENTEAQYEAASRAMAAAEAESATEVLMVIRAPEVVDAAGRTVPAALSVHDDTVSLNVKPGEGATYPLLAQVSVAAPTDAQSAERDPFEYGLSDQQLKTFITPEATAKTAAETKARENVGRLKEASAPLHIQSARRVIFWNILTPARATELKQTEEWLAEVRKDGLEPYLTLEAQEGESGPPSVPAYRDAVKAIVAKFEKEDGVVWWGAWNEPDLKPNNVTPGRAADYWQAAESAVLELGCGCTVVAGEFYEFADQADRDFVSKYQRALLAYDPQAWNKNRPEWKRYGIPHTWGFHDYEDVVQERTTNASEFEYFTTRGPFGKPRIWISEAGVELHDGVKDGPPTRLVKAGDEGYEYEQQKKAANVFLALRYAHPEHEPRALVSRVEKVYYYEYEAPAEAKVAKNGNEFDSGLVESEPEGEGKSYGEARTAYCFLAYADHDCPPTVTTLKEPALGAQVDSHGLITEVWFNVDGERNSTVQMIAGGLLRPQRLSPPSGTAGCNPYSIVAVAKNAGGEVVGNPPAVSTEVTCR